MVMRLISGSHVGILICLILASHYISSLSQTCQQHETNCSREFVPAFDPSASVSPIYSTAIFVDDLTNDELDINTLRKTVLQLAKNMKNTLKSNRGGYQSDGNILDFIGQYPILNQLAVQLGYSINEYVRQLGMAAGLKGSPFPSWTNGQHYAMQSRVWININKAGDYNLAHTHPSSYVSGVLYLADGGAGTPIKFGDPRNGLTVLPGNDTALEGPSRSHGAWAEGDETVNAKIGRIVCFPGWLRHWVPPSQGKKSRISISFNVEFISLNSVPTATRSKVLRSEGHRPKPKHDALRTPSIHNLSVGSRGLPGLSVLWPTPLYRAKVNSTSFDLELAAKLVLSSSEELRMLHSLEAGWKRVLPDLTVARDDAWNELALTAQAFLKLHLQQFASNLLREEAAAGRLTWIPALSGLAFDIYDFRMASRLLSWREAQLQAGGFAARGFSGMLILKSLCQSEIRLADPRPSQEFDLEPWLVGSMTKALTSVWRLEEGTIFIWPSGMRHDIDPGIGKRCQLSYLEFTAAVALKYD